MKLKKIDWSEEKNSWLRKHRGVEFEQVVALLTEGKVLDIKRHPNSEKYLHQQIFVLEIGAYIYLVPFVESEDALFLKTIIPSRKALRHYRKEP
jgi:uncharacterized DUF497 family protein